MDHPLTSSLKGLGIILASLLSLFHTSSQAQVISGLTAYQSGTAIVLELANISSVSIDALSFYYSRDGGSSWELINDNCLLPVSSRSVEWAVLECLGVEVFAGNNIRFRASASSCHGTFRFDEYDYRIVEIGDQCWFAENLRSKHYANGDAIKGNLSGHNWVLAKSGAFAVFGEGDSECAGACNEVANFRAYGNLYNWYAVDDYRGLCPAGWYIPYDSDWETLEKTLGVVKTEKDDSGINLGHGWLGTDQGDKLKSSKHDIPFTWNGSNKTGFSARPGGVRDGFDYSDDRNGRFVDVGEAGYWWSASKHTLFKAAYWMLSKNEGGIGADIAFFENGFSVRCLRMNTDK